jgi:hypothetical protein
MIEVAADTRWQAASWLFDWVLNTIAASTADAELAAEITEIVAENLGWLSLRELSPQQRRDVRQAMNSLAEQATSGLPSDQAVALVNDLVSMVRTALSDDTADR